MAAAVAALEEDGQTAAVMLTDDVAAAVLGIADRIRPEAAATIARITAVTGTPPVLLTGDDQRAAARLAAQVLGHEGSTVIVGLNGLRLLRSRAWPGAVR